MKGERSRLGSSLVVHQTGAYPSFSSNEATRSISTPHGCDAGTSQGYPLSIKFAGSHLYNWVERCTVRDKCLAQ